MERNFVQKLNKMTNLCFRGNCWQDIAFSSAFGFVRFWHERAHLVKCRHQLTRKQLLVSGWNWFVQFKILSIYFINRNCQCLITRYTWEDSRSLWKTSSWRDKVHLDDNVDDNDGDNDDDDNKEPEIQSLPGGVTAASSMFTLSGSEQKHQDTKKTSRHKKKHRPQVISR